MLNRFVSLILLILISIFSDFSLAEGRYWVCVASFKDRAMAQDHRAAVGRDYAQEVSVVVGQTAWGEQYRVVLGPFTGMPDAQRALTDAQQRRPDAWIVTAGADDVSSDLSSDSAYTDSAYDDSYDSSYDDSYETTYDVPYDATYDSSYDASFDETAAGDDAEYGDLAPLSERREPSDRAERTPRSEPPTEAPPGYHAHELRRTATDD